MSEQIPIPPQDGQRPAARAVLAGLCTAVLVAGLWIWIVLMTTGDGRVYVGIAGGVTGLLLSLAVFVAVQRTDLVRGIEGNAQRAWQEARTMRSAAENMRGELARLADQILPAAVAKLRAGVTAEALLNDIPQLPDELHQRVLTTLISEIAIGERRRAAATAACANAAGRVQALSTSTLADLREMENRCTDDMLGDLLRIDHSTAQTGRLADSIAVLTGARSGRRWTKPIKMESILRGAMGRIGAYQRIRVHSTSPVAVAGYAAEDVMHALAELMDNATKFSAPSEEVHIYVEDLHNGTVITIEDGGLGMKPQALARAEQSVSQNQQLDLTMLAGTRLGLAVVGCLARKHHLHVFFRPSSRGGIGVVLRIPNQLITQPRAEALLEPAPQRQPAAAGVSASRSANQPVIVSDAEIVTDDRADGTDLADLAEHASAVPVTEPAVLPKRPRGQTLDAARPAPSPTPAADRPRPDAGARFGAFQQGRARRDPADGETAILPAVIEVTDQAGSATTTDEA